MSRVVCFSSAQVFGCSEGEGEPVYLPIDDAHPLRAARPYGMSKRLTEEMCEAWTFRTAIPTVVLRPVHILDDRELERIAEADLEFGAFVHVADAATLAVTTPLSGHHRVTLCGPGRFDTSRARNLLRWTPTRAWSTHSPVVGTDTPPVTEELQP